MESKSSQTMQNAVTMHLYRYVGHGERDYIVNNRRIKSRHCETYLSPDYYDSPGDAAEYLSLPMTPSYRVGPIWSLDVTFDGISLRRVRAKYGRHGGGLEVSTHQPVIYGAINSI